jgi:putative transposase
MRCNRHGQREIVFRTHGGKRHGAGRKPSGDRPGVTHAKRPTLTGREPVLVTLKVRREVSRLRSRDVLRRLLPALVAARDGLMRLVHFSVQHDHVHLIVEARNERELARGAQGLSVRLARRLNDAMKRTGKVFADRYHARVLGTPRQVRHAMAYVLCNARKHGVPLSEPRIGSVLERGGVRCVGGACGDLDARALASACVGRGRTDDVAAAGRLASRRRSTRSESLPRHARARCGRPRHIARATLALDDGRAETAKRSVDVFARDRRAMNLSSHEQLVLGGILRFALRFDGLSAAQRVEALGRAGDALGLRAEEVRRVSSSRAGYRDAAFVVRSVTNELDVYLTRAAEEIAGDRALRRLIEGVTQPDVRLACVLAVETLAREVSAIQEKATRPTDRKRTIFLDWLRDRWGLPPITSDGSESSESSELATGRQRSE